MIEQPIPNLNQSIQTDTATDQKFQLPTVLLDEDDANAFEVIFTDIDALNGAHGVAPEVIGTDPLADAIENNTELNWIELLDSNLHTSIEIEQMSSEIAPAATVMHLERQSLNIEDGTVLFKLLLPMQMPANPAHWQTMYQTKAIRKQSSNW